MAKLIVGLNNTNRRIAICDNCNHQIYAPSNNVLYIHCYCCGAKFEQEYSARDIKKLCEKPREWCDYWRDYLKANYYSVYKRLCECRNTKSDLLLIAKVIYRFNNNDYTKEECLDRTISWLTDWNNQPELIPINYKWYLDRM